MFSSLQNHPFAVDAFFKTSLVLTFAAPLKSLQHLLPPCLELDTFQQETGFIALALVDTCALRPAGFPRFMGSNFILAGYRVFVRYTNHAGKRLRGLYILGSATNRKKMKYLGALFTKYRYHTIDINWNGDADESRIMSTGGKLDIVYREGQEISLPEGSPFEDWKQARRFAGPMPFTFSYEASRREVLIVEGVRSEWLPQPVEVLHCESGFIEELELTGLHLANAFIIKNVPYHWKKGRTEIWQS